MAVCGELPKVTPPSVGQVKPEGEELDTDRLTPPVKPFKPVTVIV